MASSGLWHTAENVWFKHFKFLTFLALYIEHILLSEHYGHITYGFSNFLDSQHKPPHTTYFPLPHTIMTSVTINKVLPMSKRMKNALE